MKIGIIMALIGAVLLVGAYFSFTQVSSTIANSQNAQISSNTNVWETTVILGIVGALFFLIGINVTISSMKRRAIGYVENKVGGRINNIAMETIMSHIPRPARPTPPAPRASTPNEPSAQVEPPKDAQSPLDTK